MRSGLWAALVATSCCIQHAVGGEEARGAQEEDPERKLDAPLPENAHLPWSDSPGVWRMENETESEESRKIDSRWIKHKQDLSDEEWYKNPIAFLDPEEPIMRKGGTGVHHELDYVTFVATHGKPDPRLQSEHSDHDPMLLPLPYVMAGYDLRQAFDKIDADGDGVIRGVDELKSLHTAPFMRQKPRPLAKEYGYTFEHFWRRHSLKFRDDALETKYSVEGEFKRHDLDGNSHLDAIEWRELQGFAKKHFPHWDL